MEDERKERSGDKRSLDLEFVKICLQNMNRTRENTKLKEERSSQLQERRSQLLERNRKIQERELELELQLRQNEKKFRERDIELKKKFLEEEIQIKEKILREKEINRKSLENHEIKSNQIRHDKNAGSFSKEAFKKWEDQFIGPKRRDKTLHKNKDFSDGKIIGNKLCEVITKHGEDLTKWNSGKLDEVTNNLSEVNQKEIPLQINENVGGVQESTEKEMENKNGVLNSFVENKEEITDHLLINTLQDCGVKVIEVNQKTIPIQLNVCMMMNEERKFSLPWSKEDVILPEGFLRYIRTKEVPQCFDRKNQKIQEVFFSVTIRMEWLRRIYLLINPQIWTVFDPGIQLREVSI